MRNTSGQENVVRRILRPMTTMLILVGGVACFLHGVLVHEAMVAEEQQRDVLLPSPPTYFPGGPPGMAGPGNDDPFANPFAPPPFLEKLQETILVTAATRETRLVREVTVGGVTRLASGELRRTYSGETPSLCPT